MHQADQDARSEGITVQITLPAGETLGISSNAFCVLGLVKAISTVLTADISGLRLCSASQDECVVSEVLGRAGKVGAN